MELTIGHDFIFNMYELISIPNRHLIRQLLTYDCVSVSQVHFNLVKVFYALYHIPIEYSSLSYVLNSLVTSYLKSVIDKTLRSTVLNHYLLGYPVNIEHDVAGIIVNGLHDSYLYNSQFMRSTYTEIIKPPISSIPVKVHVIKSENLKISAVNKEKFPSGNDFKSFLLPLEQDYTKSSKGYSSQVSITGIKNENSCDIISEDEDLQISNCSNYENIPGKYEVNYQVQQNEFSQSSNALENKPDNAVSDDSAIISCLKDINNCTQQNLSQKNCLRNSHSQITFNYSLKVFADRVKQQLNCDTENNDSDSDNSVMFSEDSVDEINRTFVLDSIMPINASDNDNIFAENVQINEGININKFWDSEIRDSSSDDEHNWDNDFDESASDLFKTLGLNFTSNFPTLSTCLQNNVCTGNEPLSTYGYVNACFEHEDVFVSDHITNVNNSWNSTMKDVSSEPRQAKRVSFVALPHLVSVYKFESDDDGYCYSMHVLDQVRFQNRIQEFEAIIAPFLTSEHRAKIYHQNY